MTSNTIGSLKSEFVVGLLSHIEHFTNKPESIEALRKLIVCFALSGQIAKSNAHELSSAAIVEALSVKRTSPAKTGKIRRQNEDVTPVAADEIPFPANDETVWARISDVCTVEKGLLPILKANPGSFPLVTTGEQRGSHREFQFDAEAAIVPLVSSTGHGHASLKRLHYQEGKFALGNILCAVIPFDTKLLSSRFLFEYLTAFKDELLVSRMVGTANVSLTINKVSEVPIPIVCRSVQDVVCELTTLCDELAARQAARREARLALVGATLDRLVSRASNLNTSSPSPRFGERGSGGEGQHRSQRRPPHPQPFSPVAGGEGSKDMDVNRLRDHFDRLFDTPTTIPQLRQAILQLAVQGQLIPQDPNDEPAPQLLEKIKAERLKLIAEKKISKSEQTPPVDESQILFSIPDTWSWVRLPDVCNVITDGEHLTPQYAESGIPMLSAKHVGSHSLLLEDFKLVSHATAVKCWSRCCPDERDILVVSRGGGVGRTIISGRRDFCLMGSVLLFKLASHVDERFLCYFLNSTLGNAKLRTTSGASAQQAIYIAHLKRDYVVPIPPLSEQKRIVSKVTELLSLCDALEAKLTQAESASTQLLSAAVHHLLTGANPNA